MKKEVIRVEPLSTLSRHRASYRPTTTFIGSLTASNVVCSTL
jgi:hypothetical protein